MNLKMVFPLFLLALSVPAFALKTFKVESYFDGYDLHRGPFVFEVNDQKIVGIKKVKLEEKEQVKAFLMPGLIEGHAHLYFQHYLPYGEYPSNHKRNFLIPKNELYKRNEGFLVDYLHKGYLYIRDLGGDRFGRDGIVDVLKDRGEFYPYSLLTGETFKWGYGYCPPPLPCYRIHNDAKKLSKEQAFSIIKKSKEDGFHLIKVFVDAGDPEQEDMPLDWIKFFIKSTRDLRMHVAFHVGYGYDYTEFLPWVQDHVSLEHVFDIKGGNFQDLTKGTLVLTDNSTSFINTITQLGTGDPTFHYDKEITSKRFKKLLKNKIPVCFGGDFNFEVMDPVRTRAYWTTEALIDYYHLGMDTLEVLKSATSNCFSLFDWAPPEIRPHKIAVGEQADFIILGQSPFKNINALHEIRHVVKKGRLLVRP